MTIIVYNENRQSIRAALYSYDAAGVEIGQDTINPGGAEIEILPDATQWRFVAPGYQDAGVNDLPDYDNYAMELIPKYRWVAPLVVGLSLYWLLTRAIKS
jgi:hypothetical protein